MGLWKPKPCSPDVRFKALKAPSRERKQQTSMGRQESSRLLWGDPVQQYPREEGQAGLQTKVFSLAEPAVPTAAGDRRSSREVALNLAEHVAVPAAPVCSVPDSFPSSPEGSCPHPLGPVRLFGEVPRGGDQGALSSFPSPCSIPLLPLHTLQPKKLLLGPQTPLADTPPSLCSHSSPCLDSPISCLAGELLGILQNPVWMTPLL